MDVIELLARDHRKLEELFRSLEKSAHQQRAQLVATLRAELVAHFAASDEVLYPSVFQTAEDDAARRCVAAARAQASKIRLLLDVLGGLAPDDPHMDETLERLRQGVLRHVAQEEEKLFPVARRQLSAEDLDELAMRALQRKRQTPATDSADPSLRRRATDHAAGPRRRATTIRVVNPTPAVGARRPRPAGPRRKRRR